MPAAATRSRSFRCSGMGEIVPGADLAAEIGAALEQQGTPLQDGDILVVTQKIVSKAEGCLVRLDDIEPSALATAVGGAVEQGRPRRRAGPAPEPPHRAHGARRDHQRDAPRPGVRQRRRRPVERRQRLRHPAARSTRTPPPRGCAPRSAQASGARIGVVISDTFGRAWREGQTNIAIGVAGVEALRHFEGQLDPTGYELRVTMLATADELASAAELVMGKVDAVPVAVVRGLERALGPGSARSWSARRPTTCSDERLQRRPSRSTIFWRSTCASGGSSTCGRFRLRASRRTSSRWTSRPEIGRRRSSAQLTAALPGRGPVLGRQVLGGGQLPAPTDRHVLLGGAWCSACQTPTATWC